MKVIIFGKGDEKEIRREMENLEEKKYEIKNKNRHILTIDNDFFKFNIGNFKKDDLLVITSFLYIAQETNSPEKIVIDYADYVNTFFKHLKRQGKSRREINNRILGAIKKITTLQLETENAAYSIFPTVLIKKEEGERPIIEIKVNQDLRYLLEDFDAGNFTKIIYEMLVRIKAKTAHKLYLYLLHYKGAADKNGYHRVQIGKNQLIKEMYMREGISSGNIKTILDRTMEYFKKDNIFEEIKYKPIKKDNVNADGYQYQTITSYVFTWKDKAREAIANNQYVSKEQEEELLQLIEDSKKKEEELREERRKERERLNATDLSEEEFNERVDIKNLFGDSIEY